MIAIHSPNRSACRLAMLFGRWGHTLHQEVLPLLAVFRSPSQAFQSPIIHAASVLYLETSLLLSFRLHHRENRRGAVGGDHPQGERGNLAQAVFRRGVSHLTLERSRTTSPLQRCNSAADSRVPGHIWRHPSARPHSEAGSSAAVLF